MSERLVIGEIVPAADEKDRPTFRIIQENQTWDIGPNVRPCNHLHYALDDKWSTVTCEDCGERLTAYSVLRDYARWQEKYKAQAQLAEQAEKRMLVTNLRRLSRLRATTPDERKEIDGLLRRQWSVTAKQMSHVADGIECLVRERKSARRSERRRRKV